MKFMKCLGLAAALLVPFVAYAANTYTLGKTAVYQITKSSVSITNGQTAVLVPATGPGLGATVGALRTDIIQISGGSTSTIDFVANPTAGAGYSTIYTGGVAASFGTLLGYVNLSVGSSGFIVTNVSLTASTLTTNFLVVGGSTTGLLTLAVVTNVTLSSSSAVNATANIFSGSQYGKSDVQPDCPIYVTCPATPVSTNVFTVYQYIGDCLGRPIASTVAVSSVTISTNSATAIAPSNPAALRRVLTASGGSVMATAVVDYVSNVTVTAAAISQNSAVNGQSLTFDAATSIVPQVPLYAIGNYSTNAAYTNITFKLYDFMQ